MNRELAALLRRREATQRLLTLDSFAEGGRRATAFTAFMKSERERCGRIIMAIRITPE